MKLLLPLALFLPSLAFADCPSHFAYSMQYDWSSTSPVWSTGIVCGSVAVNMPAGTIELAGGGGTLHFSCSSGLNASDTYQIVGPASATPLAFNLRVQISGDLGASINYEPHLGGDVCYSTSVFSRVYAGALKLDEFSDESGGAACTPKTTSAMRTIPLSKLPGEAFTLTFGLNVAGPGSGWIRQTVKFDGLPQGYSVASCHGYNVAPTPATTASWGSLKASYR